MRVTQRAVKETGRDKGSSFRSQHATSDLTLHAMEFPPAVNEEHRSPSAVVQWNTWIGQALAGQTGGCLWFQPNFQKLPAIQALFSNNLGYVKMWPLPHFVPDQRIWPLGYHPSNRQLHLCRTLSTAPAWDLQPPPCPMLLWKHE